MPTPEPYSREWHEAHIDDLVPQMAAAMEAWLERDREDWRASNHAAGRLQLLMQNISAEAAAIRAIDAQAYQRREPWYNFRW